MFDILANALGQMLGELFGHSLEQLLDKRKLDRELVAAVQRAEERFARENREMGAELAGMLANQTHFAALPSVRAALRDLVTHPFHDPAAPIAILQRSFADVLPERTDRGRVDAAMHIFLGYLGQEVLYIPQLQRLYTLVFQKSNAESSHKIAAGAEALIQEISALRANIGQLPAGANPPRLAPDPRQIGAAQPGIGGGTGRPLAGHNLPQRSYTRFVGRKEELAKLTNLLLPYPRSRHFLVTVDGIGGVGKSALAIELAYRYREGYATLPADERFDAIVWISAKRTLLTASGVQQRQQTFSTLGDLYREIATVLEQPAILQAEADQRRGLVERALSAQRTLLIVDNLETVDDEELLTFLRELPDPTKAIVTTRHRIDIAYAIRLTGMPRADAQALMVVEAARKGVDLAPEAEGELYRRTGGVPLAIVWSIGLMSMGYSVESVLRRLGSGHSDIARFCFAESVARIRDRDAYKLLLALALFERSVNRKMLGAVAGLDDDLIGRDDGLAELLQLSLVEHKSDRFKLLPLTQSYALEELAAQPELEQELRERWVICLTELAQPYTGLHWRWRDLHVLNQEGVHLITLSTWSRKAMRPDILLHIFPALASYYNLMGQWADLLSIGQICLEYAQLKGDLESIVSIETHALARVLSRQGHQQDAEHAIIDALNIARRMGDSAWQCEVLVRYSQVLRRRKAFDQALESCQSALQFVMDPQHGYMRAHIEHELGKIARDRRDWQIAQVHFLAAQKLFDHDDIEYVWDLLSNLALVEYQLGNLEGAAQMYLQSLDFVRARGSKAYLTTLLIRLASLEEQRGNHAASLEHAREALEWSSRLGMMQEQAQAEAIIGRSGPLKR